MKIKKRRFLSGRDVRYFDHRLGAYSATRSKFFTLVLPVIFLFGFSSIGLFGYQYYDNQKPVQVAQEISQQVTKEEEKIAEPAAKKPLQATEDAAMGNVIKSKLKDMPKTTSWSVSVRDLKTGKMANIDSDIKLPAGNLSKMFMIPALEKKAPTDNWKIFLGKRNIKDCVQAMIETADEPCAKAVANYAGWATIDPVNSSLGFVNTSIKSQDSQVTTAREAADMIYRLQSGQVLTDKARRVFFDGLYDQKSRNGIPVACGSNCLVGNIPSETGTYKHDVGIVKVADAHYVVSIMSNNASWQQVAEVAYGINKLMLP